MKLLLMIWICLVVTQTKKRLSKLPRKLQKEWLTQNKKPKKQVIAMSIVFLEVKPLDSETNLDDL